MFLSNLSIKRPVVATVMMLTLVTLGLFSVKRLPIDLMPEVEIPVLSILTEFPGASPESVEREVSRKIEEAVNPIAGVKHVASVSREGLSSVVVEFNLEVKINDVSQEARAKINSIRRELPAGLNDPVIQDPEILPGPPRGQEPELAGHDTRQRYPAEMQDIHTVFRSAVLRAGKAIAGPPDRDKDGKAQAEEDEPEPGFLEEVALQYDPAPCRGRYRLPDRFCRQRSACHTPLPGPLS